MTKRHLRQLREILANRFSKVELPEAKEIWKVFKLNGKFVEQKRVLVVFCPTSKSSSSKRDEHLELFRFVSITQFFSSFDRGKYQNYTNSSKGRN